MFVVEVEVKWVTGTVNQWSRGRVRFRISSEVDPNGKTWERNLSSASETSSFSSSSSSSSRPRANKAVWSTE